MVDFVEICKVCARKAIIGAAKRIINSDKLCHSYSDLNFGVTFWNTVYDRLFRHATVLLHMCEVLYHTSEISRQSARTWL